MATTRSMHFILGVEKHLACTSPDIVQDTLQGLVPGGSWPSNSSSVFANVSGLVGHPWRLLPVSRPTQQRGPPSLSPLCAGYQEIDQHFNQCHSLSSSEVVNRSELILYTCYVYYIRVHTFVLSDQELSTLQLSHSLSTSHLNWA